LGWASPSQPGSITGPSQWSSRVINYLRTMLNALKIQKEWKGRESLPCRRLLCLSVSVLGEDQWRCSLLGNQNSSFYLCFPALCFFFSRLFCSIVHCPFVLSGFSEFENTMIPLRQCFTIFNSKVQFVILLYIRMQNTRKDPLPELNNFLLLRVAKSFYCA